jgi:hypothetical protein
MTQETKASASELDPAGVAEIPIRQLVAYLKFIAEHNLWDEVETHLTSSGQKNILMSYDHLHLVDTFLSNKLKTGGVHKKTHPLPLCGSNGPVGPRPGPVTPPTPPPPPPDPPDGGDGGRGGGIPIE